MTCYFAYGEKETEYLKSKDRKLGAVIDQLGHVKRAADSDVFSSVIHQIIGQQISTKALASIWERMQSDLGEISPETLLAAGEEKIQSYGTTFHKADYIIEFAEKVQDGRINLEEIQALPEEEAQKALVSLKGIGPWTAEMILLFGMQKPDILSYGDLAILRGMRM
ncbi:MAG: DNA-3-methyladenine glycosylase family protein, partial [Bulleidia sp.]